MLFSVLCSLADVPGNKPRPDYDVTISGLQQYNNHIFFVQDNNVVKGLTDSSSIHVPGGYGAPRCLEVWAINKNNFIHTDTLSFCSGDANKSKTIVVNIYNRHLSYSEAVTKGKRENVIPFSSANNNQDNKNRFNNNYRIMYLISGLSLSVLISLILFIWRKNKKPVLPQNI
jgi:hypothetical protein